MTALNDAGYATTIRTTTTSAGTAREVIGKGEMLRSVVLGANDGKTLISIASVCVPGDFTDYHH